MVGVMRGSEICEEFNFDPDSGNLLATGSHQIPAGGIDLVSPRIGDIHRVSNALTDKPSVSIHVYGANIGAVSRHVYELPSGISSTFISGYSSSVVPNLWDRSVVV
jgi:predicted metal-dependent enzyme (double-stranded beta helix superfamily)